MSNVPDPTDIRSQPQPPPDPTPFWGPDFAIGSSDPARRVCQWDGCGPARLFDLDGSWATETCRRRDRESAKWNTSPSPAALDFEIAALRLLRDRL